MNAREGALKKYHFVGNPLQFDPADYLGQRALRERLGHGPGRLLICSAGGTAIGGDLLRLCIDAYPSMKRRLPDLRMMMVKKSRMSKDLGPITPGVAVLGYVPRLFEHFAAADMAIVQGGGGSTLELSALNKPFLYFPMKGHSKQQIKVSRKLERNHLGIKCSFEEMDQQRLAELVVENIDAKVRYPPISYQGCRNAASLIADRLSKW